jgi:hypothetical protein
MTSCDDIPFYRYIQSGFSIDYLFREFGISYEEATRIFEDFDKSYCKNVLDE